jgi:hypothetical protein
MRDPEGVLQLDGTRLLRRLYHPVAADHFLLSEPAARLVSQQRLVAFKFLNDTTIESSHIPFVTYPHEWTDSQHLSAASLTLDVCEAAEGVGYELKDASAWNVLFDGMRPVFCDHLSFVKRSSRRWRAFAQFVCHFILPLAVSRYRGVTSRECFLLSKDGIAPEQAQRLLGWRRFATRYWPLTLKSDASVNETDRTKGTAYHTNLYSLCRWFLSGAQASASRTRHWAEYVHDRNHYSALAQEVKREVVHKWLAELRPSWVTDIGCNTGEFSRLALSLGANVVSVDLDAESIDRLRASCTSEAKLYSVVGDLQDAVGERGWVGGEFPSLSDRLEKVKSLGLMLGVTHHLAVSSSIPYPVIFEFLHRIVGRSAIVELIGEQDPMLKLLCDQRNRTPAEFSIEKQRAGLTRFFAIVDEVPIPETDRCLLLLEKK